MTLEQIIQLIGASPYLAFVAALFMLINAFREFVRSESGQHLIKHGFTVHVSHRLEEAEREHLRKMFKGVEEQIDSSAFVLSKVLQQLHQERGEPTVPNTSSNGVETHPQKTQQAQQ